MKQDANRDPLRFVHGLRRNLISPHQEAHRRPYVVACVTVIRWAPSYPHEYLNYGEIIYSFDV